MLYEVSFLSFNGRDNVAAWYYVPAARPKGIVQLIHGFGEHSRRYLHMISKFVDEGFIVVADDHVGHGKTAQINNTWGDWGDKGYETMVEDEKKLHDLASEKFPGLPYFIFGHSMGSVIARQFISRYGKLLKGVTLCGTCGSFPVDKAKKILEKEVEAGREKETSPEAGAALLGWMCERCGNVKIGNEWICADPYVQIDHATDPFNAFTKPTSNQAILYFIRMIEEVNSDEWFRSVPKELPVYSIGGDQDPFGTYGSGLYEVSNRLIKNGNDVKTKVYCGYRHEIHNYTDIRDEVEKGITDFMEWQLLGKVK